MPQEQIDRTPGYVNQLSNAMDQLGATISAQGIGVSEKLDHASYRVQKAVDAATDRMSKAVDKASDASERHAKSLVRATWALVFATIVLVVVTAIHVYIAAAAGSGLG